MSTALALFGKTVVISGSTRGLGFAFARDALLQGAAVVLNGRSAEACEAALQRLGPLATRAVAHAGSIADEACADAVVALAVERFGGLNGVVNNAGVVRDRSLMKMSADEFDDVMHTHARGCWLLTRAGARAMRETGGSVINVVSGTALYGIFGQSNYAAAKGAMLGMTRSLSLELARYAIRVNAILPMAATEMTAGTGLDDHLGTVEAVAPLVSYLVSDASKHLSAQVIGFDGCELTLWSHPAPRQQHGATGWTQNLLAAAFEGSMVPEPLNPDTLGQFTRRSEPRT